MGFGGIPKSDASLQVFILHVFCNGWYEAKKNLSLIGIYSVSAFSFWNIRQIIGCQSDIWSVWWCEKSTKKQIQDHGRFITHGLWTCQKLTFQTTLNNLRSWIPDNHCYLTTKSDTKQRSQFLQFNDFFVVSIFSGRPRQSSKEVSLPGSVWASAFWWRPWREWRQGWDGRQTRRRWWEEERSFNMLLKFIYII